MHYQVISCVFSLQQKPQCTFGLWYNEVAMVNARLRIFCIRIGSDIYDSKI